MVDATQIDAERRAALVTAEGRAIRLFDEIEAQGLLRSARNERDVERDIYRIALDQLRSIGTRELFYPGPNTLTIAADNPPVRTIDDDDIVYVDLGPVFEDGEADIGRTYILGEHPGGRLANASSRRIGPCPALDSQDTSCRPEPEVWWVLQATTLIGTPQFAHR